MNKGAFVNLFLPFMREGKTVPAGEQAKEILLKAEELINDGYQGVAITYSANYDQTRQIEEVYDHHGWETRTNGANQASVIHEMERLLEKTYSGLQGKMHVAPITTMNGYSSPLRPWNEEVHLTLVRRDLNRIKDYLESGWCVLGWQNQITIDDPLHPYTIGGGIARLPNAVTELIQSTLTEFRTHYHPLPQKP